jgi:hypothetical protein
VELPFVEPLALPEREQVEGVRVVRDEHEACAHVLAVDREALPAPPVLQRQHERPESRERVAAAAVVLTPVHQARVETERDVVEEEPVARARDVDPPLGTFEGFQRRERVVAVEPEVAGEVVPRPERDADECRAGLDRGCGDPGEGAVAACGAQDGSAGGPGKLRRVVAPLQEVRLDAALPGGARELVGARVAVAGARVDQEEALHGGPTLAADLGPGARK